MGKSQGIHLVTTASSNLPSSTMDIESETPKWGDECPNYDSSFLNACHDRAYLQERPIIGSPPPKSQTPPYWDEPEPYVNTPNYGRDRQNNNRREDRNRAAHDAAAERREILELTASVQRLRLQPIIICEYVDDATNKESAVAVEEEKDETLTLSVPPVDVRNEKKRPPISGLNA